MNNTLEQTEQQLKRKLRQQLKSIITPQAQRLHWALIAAVLATLLFIGQSWLLAQLFVGLLDSIHTGSELSAAFDLRHAIALTLCFTLRPIAQYIRERLSQAASFHARIQLRTRLLNTLSNLGPERQTLGSDGVLSTQLLEQVDALDGYISRYYVQLYLVLITPLLISVAAFYYSPLAAILMLMTAPLVPVFMILVGSAASRSSQQQMAAMSQLSGRFLDWVRGMPTLQHLKATALAQHDVDSSASQYRDTTMKVLRLAFLSGAVLELFSSLAIALVALYLGLGLLGILPWAKGITPVPYAGALFILLLAPEFYAPLRQLGSDYHAKAEAEGAIEELLPLLEQHTWQHPGQHPLLLEAAPAIRLENLSITAHNGRIRLPKTKLSIAAGERIGLYGESGSGKSSLLLALLGFIPYTGHILINQDSLLDLRRSDWHRQIGYLSQQPNFKRGSLADNLRLAHANATDSQLYQVLADVDLLSLVKKLPQGLDTPIGERGLGLSGGQLSRLAIAQLLLRDTQLWLLDEPTAHLDPDTSAKIHTLLEKLSRDKTLILVSHQWQGLHWLDRHLDLHELHTH
ncbi:thiol reductant ABC exporter subunit CydD [Denitrificimonas sp. JX-1]|uniref:Thiol reductant ABC exporter subunit CydD n=1 Tax=Denitrificimonas halotolerans TaxID=3098930 RepID=A0ABU5GQ88_9GAMM|nr:thiol reductant ABC exporter subunit CydD [Denitrificimonas sp. JX-1]MDY7219159.1 thiol reductant ABC exporter subunit CydD [Denitrificimonas sp. JX-1]